MVNNTAEVYKPFELLDLDQPMLIKRVITNFKKQSQIKYVSREVFLHPYIKAEAIKLYGLMLMQDPNKTTTLTMLAGEAGFNKTDIKEAMSNLISCELLYQDNEALIWYMGNIKCSAKSVKVIWRGSYPDLY